MGTDLNASHTEFADRAEVADAASAADIPSDIDVLVVGYGPVGATIANLLGRYGVRVLVVDKDKEIFMAPAGHRLGQRGAENSATGRARGRRFRQGRDSLRAHAFASARRVRSDQHARPHRRASQTRDVLPARARSGAATPRVAVRRGSHRARRRPDRVCRERRRRRRDPRCRRRPDLHRCARAISSARTARVRSSASSSGRRSRDETYAEDWLIVDALGAQSPIDHVEFLCDHRRPTPHMTAPGGRERWEFMLRPGETRADMESDARVSELLAALGRSCGDDDRAQGRLSLSRPHRQGLPQGPGLSRRRRGAHHAAVRRSGAGRRIARRGEPVLEDRLGPARPRRAQRFSTATTRSVAPTPRR